MQQQRQKSGPKEKVTPDRATCVLENCQHSVLEIMLLCRVWKGGESIKSSCSNTVIMGVICGIYAMHRCGRAAGQLSSIGFQCAAQGNGKHYTIEILNLSVQRWCQLFLLALLDAKNKIGRVNSCTYKVCVKVWSFVVVSFELTREWRATRLLLLSLFHH